MKHRTVFFVSDQTGVTAETLGHSLLTQFDGLRFRGVTVPFINTPDKVRECVRRIDLTREVEGSRPIVFATMVQDDLRDIISQSQGLVLDFFGAFIGPMERELGIVSSHATGKAHGVADQRSYTRRIDAMNYALEHDDGSTTRDYSKADLILVGVSRSGKTPTCLYMALRYGVYAANYPLTEEEFERGKLPAPLERYRDRLFGLTIKPARLQQIRQERRPESNYASARQVSFELRSAEALFARYGIQYLDTGECSVEEIASTVLDRTGLLNRMQGVDGGEV
ncbi:pyruvate, water dikinase regulatory protein [Wenzhouxiangella sp. XN24]|uniref:posphoenolpyruvate synthetase regulatory kinase/phosphorylase PpsR n=1 Tax=Wenzhouxiangella sp. XN24 TaxID=2713569 RepID=UPI0013EC8777|nr:pyruvate, water dikinase regulatory protein [Wenzhouxiangella sp. XN24]NGX15413.1 kinase/pyrophosphorylase [Wenzhouxiangella sp. XN24]